MPPKKNPGTTNQGKNQQNRTLSRPHSGVDHPATRAAPSQDFPSLGSSSATQPTRTKRVSVQRPHAAAPAAAAAPAPAAAAAAEVPKWGPQKSQGSAPRGRTAPGGGAAAAAAARTTARTPAAAAAAAAAAATGTRTTSSARSIQRTDDDSVVTDVVVPKGAPPAAWRPVELMTNHFQVSLNTTVYEYSATFEPDLKDSPARRRLIYRLKLGGMIDMVGNVIFLTQKVDDPIHALSDEESRISGGVIITLSKVKEYPPGSAISIQAFATLIQRAFRKAEYQQIGRNFFNMQKQKKVDLFSVIPGVIMTVVPSTKGLSLICDVTNKVSRNETALMVWEQLKHNQGAFRARMMESSVYTLYNNRFYKVTGVDFTMTPMSTFERDGKPISFAKYTQERYGRTVRIPDQPMLECNHRGDKVYLIPEFCQMTGLTDYDRSNFQLMKKMTDCLFPRPRERMAMIQDSVDTMKKNTDRSVSLSVSPALTARGSVIAPPRLPVMKAPDVFKSTEFKKGGLPLKKLAVVWDEAGERFKREAAEGIKMLKDMVVKDMRDMGITGMTLVDVAYDRDVRRMKAALQAVIPDFVLFVASRKNDKIGYQNIKHVCTHELGIPSQVTVSRNLSDPKRGFAVMQNVVRQMAVKLGKCPWVMPFGPYTQGTMVFGLDVCHTTSIGKSIVGMCATLDDSFGRYINDFSVQDRGKEIVNDLTPFVKKAVLKYFNRNKKYPKNILFLRDGVGDGQLDYVHGTEMEAVKDVVAEICPTTKITFIVVKKGIHTRFFARGENPIPGTVVDDPAIAHPGWYDFFLISHETRNGTVSPTHYNVIQDDIKWSKSDLQLFIYQMCYEYFNWNGSISVPAPCQYAHKLAFLYGQILSDPRRIPTVPDTLSCTLFQI